MKHFLHCLNFQTGNFLPFLPQLKKKYFLKIECFCKKFFFTKFSQIFQEVFAMMFFQFHVFRQISQHHLTTLSHFSHFLQKHYWKGENFSIQNFFP